MVGVGIAAIGFRKGSGGSKPVVNGLVASGGPSNSGARPTGPNVNGTAIALNGSVIAMITPGSLPSAQEAIVTSTINNIQTGNKPSGPQGVRWGVPFQNREGELPAGQYTEY